MKLHRFHFTPQGLVRALSHLRAGYWLCRSTGLAFRPLIPASVNSMTAAYNTYQTFKAEHLDLPLTILDVGANQSQMTRLLLGISPHAKVISFEPNPTINPMGDVKRVALSDQDGSADLRVPEGETGWGSINTPQGDIATQAKCFKVTTRRMETLINSGQVLWNTLKKPILVKIDTEGGEKRVLDGFGSYLNDVRYLLIEVNNAIHEGQDYDLLSIASVLTDHGFNRSRMVYTCYDGPHAPPYSDILFWKR
jgi:FkbM family methyltransferase